MHPPPPCQPAAGRLQIAQHCDMVECLRYRTTAPHLRPPDCGTAFPDPAPECAGVDWVYENQKPCHGTDGICDDGSVSRGRRWSRAPGLHPRAPSFRLLPAACRLPAINSPPPAPCLYPRAACLPACLPASQRPSPVAAAPTQCWKQTTMQEVIAMLKVTACARAARARAA